jgi:hypothetical protein
LSHGNVSYVYRAHHKRFANVAQPQSRGNDASIELLAPPTGFTVSIINLEHAA